MLKPRSVAFYKADMNQTNLSQPSHERVLESVALIMLMTVSSFLNVSTCVIIARDRLLRTRPANVFVANLCLSNMVLTLFVVPFSLATLFWDKHGAYSGPACTANGFFSVTACTAIVLTLCCVSIDRYIAVNRPTRYRTILTPRRALYMVLLTWFQALLYASFPVFGWSQYEYHPGTLHCSPAWTSGYSLYIFLSSAGFAIPLVIMVGTYFRIFQVIRKHSRKVKPHITSQRSKITSNASLQLKSLFNDPGKKGVKAAYPAAVDTQAGGNILVDFSHHGNFLCDPRPSQDMFGEMTPSKPKVVESAILPNTSVTPQQGIKQRSACGMFEKVQFNLRSRKRIGGRQIPREYQIAKTGLLLSLLFLVLWLPYLVVNSCSTSVQAHESVFHVAMWLVYMNGVANPIAYAFNNTTVKTKFRQIFKQIFGPLTRCW